MTKQDTAWIKTIPPLSADTELQSVYRSISPHDNVAHILQVQSLDPDALALHYALYRRIMFGSSPLSRADREMIAVAVSRVNSCEY